MEELWIVLVGGIVLAAALYAVIVPLTFRAVDGLIDWLVYTFAGDDALRRRAKDKLAREES